jgi:hypothetical protein
VLLQQETLLTNTLASSIRYEGLIHQTDVPEKTQQLFSYSNSEKTRHLENSIYDSKQDVG